MLLMEDFILRTFFALWKYIFTYRQKTTTNNRLSQMAGSKESITPGGVQVGRRYLNTQKYINSTPTR